MSFLEILLKRQREYFHNYYEKRKEIVSFILEIHVVFKNSEVPTLKNWSNREVEFLHLAIMYADIYLASDNRIEYDSLIIAAGCYSIAYKYEIDTYETDFIEFLYTRDLTSSCKNLHKKVIAFEWILLKTLDWRANLVTPVAFIREYADIIGIDSSKACLISLKLIILDICVIPSNWAISSLILSNDKAIDYFKPNNSEMINLLNVQSIIEDEWRLFKEEYPELRYVVNDCNLICD